jgi:ribose transport system ATP-binding protein
MENINKSFFGVRVLDNVSFDLYKGEVHALMGENGAGKSTLVKILSGIYRMDSGRILFDGKPVNIPDARTAQKTGISIIHQELNLMPHLTAAQNIFIGREKKKWHGLLLDDREQKCRTQELFDMLKIKLDPSVRMGDLVVASQQMVEIAKALSFDARVIIMDEPTAALNDLEIQELFKVIRRLRDEGKSIIYISHRMDELKQISDRVTVMRDGRHIATMETACVSVDEVIKLMVGRELDNTAIKKNKPEKRREPILEARNISRGKYVKDVSFTAYKGEILGIAGLMGAGRTELARAVFGADVRDSGEIIMHGKKIHISIPEDAVKNGIGYLSEDRKLFGLATGLSVQANILIASMEKFLKPLGIIDDKTAGMEAGKYAKELSVKTVGMKQPCRYLSGGNQQKVVIAKWLLRDSEVLFFDEPTRGIDIGAKFEIYRLIKELADRGKAVIMISSELPEILRLSDRILVMCEGRLTGELTGTEATQEKIMQFATRRK